MTARLIVRRLEPGDDRSQFHSGNIELDRFFARYAGQNQFRHHVGTTYVAVNQTDRIAGFVTVAASAIRADELPLEKAKGLPGYSMPVLRLARLAVEKRAHGTGVGAALLRAVFGLAHQLAGDVGCIGVVVDAKPEAVPFYERLGFTRLPIDAGALAERPEPIPMFLELAAIPNP